VNRKPAQGLLPSELTPAQFELLKAPPRPPARGIPPMTEEEAQPIEKRVYSPSMHLKLGQLKANFLIPYGKYKGVTGGKIKGGPGRRVFGDLGWRASGGSPHADPAGPLEFSHFSPLFFLATRCRELTNASSFSASLQCTRTKDTVTQAMDPLKKLLNTRKVLKRHMGKNLNVATTYY